MTERNRRGSNNSGAFVSHESFSFNPQTVEGVTGNEIVNKEITLIEDAVRYLRHYPGSYRDFLRRFNPEFSRLSTRSLGRLNTASAVSIETASLIVTYPSLLLVPNFPAFYRFLRTAELSSGLKRGGDILIVGSWLTTHELLAMYIKPPSSEMVESLALLPPRYSIEIGNQSEPIPLLDGESTAVEPAAKDSNFLRKIYDTNQFFGIPEKKVRVINKTIGEALYQHLVPTDIFTIMVNRADPRIFYPIDAQRQKQLKNPRKVRLAQRRAAFINRDLLNAFSNHLITEGQLIVTIGRGRPDIERDFEDRRKLLTDLLAILPSLGYRILSGIPTFLEGIQGHSFLFGGGESGIVGAVCAKKIN